MCRQQHGRGQAGEEAGCQADAGPHVGACSVRWCAKRCGEPASSQWHGGMLKSKGVHWLSRALALAPLSAARILLTPRGQGVSRQPLARAAELSGHRIRRVAARAACRGKIPWPPHGGPTWCLHAARPTGRTHVHTPPARPSAGATQTTVSASGRCWSQRGYLLVLQKTGTANLRCQPRSQQLRATLLGLQGRWRRVGVLAHHVNLRFTRVCCECWA